MASLLEVKELTKEYRGAAAVQDISMSLESGEVHALLG